MCSFKLFAAGAVVLALLASAQAAQIGHWGLVTGNRAISPPPPQLSGHLLLENGTDSLLLESGGSNELCFEGGC
jgi:hypothetical protein